MKIAYVGLGQMGKGMALNVAKSGCEFVGHDIRDCMFPDFAERGLRATLDVSEVWDADIIFLCLPGTAEVKEVVLNEGGLADRMQAGQILVDCSTIAIPPTYDIYDRLKAKGVGFIDAPISGRQSRAEDGTLTIMCGGEREVFDKVKPYLDYCGSDVIYMGGPASGQMTKMINNCIYDCNIAAFVELMCVGTKLGLDPEQLANVVNTGTGQSGASKFFAPNILEGKFDYGFTCNQAYKDVASCTEQATKHHLATPMLDAMNSYYKATLQMGYGNTYKGAFVRVAEEAMNVKFRKPGFEDCEDK